MSPAVCIVFKSVCSQYLKTSSKIEGVDGRRSKTGYRATYHASTCYVAANVNQSRDEFTLAQQANELTPTSGASSSYFSTASCVGSDSYRHTRMQSHTAEPSNFLVAATLSHLSVRLLELLLTASQPSSCCHDTDAQPPRRTLVRRCDGPYCLTGS